MDIIKTLIDIVLHLDKHLVTLTAQYGVWTYAILCLIVFCETGLVVTPFLPGDSLLFAAGALAAMGALDPWWLILILAAAAIVGDTLNYWIGYYTGPKIFLKEKSRFFNRDHLIRTHKFYEKYGGKTIIIARFIPIIRTFAPFVAGIGTMNYRRFVLYNITGGVLWVLLFILGGYYFGNIPVVKRNFTLVIMAIIVISVMPPIVEYLRHRLGGEKEESEKKKESDDA